MNRIKKPCGCARCAEQAAQRKAQRRRRVFASEHRTRALSPSEIEALRGAIRQGAGVEEIAQRFRVSVESVIGLSKIT